MWLVCLDSRLKGADVRDRWEVGEKGERACREVTKETVAETGPGPRKTEGGNMEMTW